MSPRTQLRPWNIKACDEAVPTWVAALLRRESDRPRYHDETESEAQRRCANPAVQMTAVFPSVPPNHSVPALPVDRVARDELPAMRFFERYVGAGLPVVLTPPSSPAAEGTARWEARTQAVKAATFARRPEDPECRGLGCSHESSARICAEEACMRAGKMDAAELGTAFDFPPPLPRTYFEGPVTFSGFEGHSFGDPMHHDGLCQGQLSVQFTGSKRWHLWSPSGWAVPLPDGGHLEPHTLMETELEEGDVLFFPPGWYHATLITRGVSLSGTYQFNDPPVFVQQPDRAFHRFSPLGYGACGSEPGGWDEAAAGWEYLTKEYGLRDAPSDGPGKVEL